ncbi:MAG TPA: hypothetical protein VM121_08505 [Acidimicrobiales bacterium]|nr:hypothetical protein [Acidimicrobiales bacterium]
MSYDSRATAMTSAIQRPRPVTLACSLVVLVIVTDLTGPLLPSSEGNIVFGMVATVITGAAAFGLWMLRRWGFIASVVVAALNFLQWAPAIAIGSTSVIKALAALSALACVLIMVLVTRPEARRAYR